MVEFALVFPVIITLCLGMISAAWIFFQSSAVSNGARGGARMASIETSLTDKSDPIPLLQCAGRGGESGVPNTIANAAQHATTQLAVNPELLCVKAGDTCQIAATTCRLVQTTNMTSKANISAVLFYDSSTPPKLVQVQVTLSTTVRGLAPPLDKSYTVSSSSQVPTLIGY